MREGSPLGARWMEVFVQQLINGITLGSIYGLIAIGYTMVFGIIGMVNFAHGDVFCVSAFIGLIAFLILTTWLGVSSIVVALFIVLIVGMAFTALVNWMIERLAYRPLRGSFRLAPLISAIGMSIFLSNFVQVAQGPRVKSIPPLFNDVIVRVAHERKLGLVDLRLVCTEPSDYANPIEPSGSGGAKIARAIVASLGLLR